MLQKSKTVTLRDIAQKAGVNRSTVSRVLSGSTQFPVSDECRRRIKEIAEKLQYHPRLSAKSLVSGKSYSVNLLLASIAKDLRKPGISAFVDTVSRELRKNNYNLIITPVTVSDRENMTKEIQKLLMTSTVDATIIGGGLLDEKLRELFQVNHFPVLLWDIHCRDENFGIFPAIHHLAFDENPGQEELLKHLVELGHKKIAYITNGPCMDIIPAFKRAVVKHKFNFSNKDIFEFYNWRQTHIDISEKQMYFYKKTAEKWDQLKEYSAIVCIEPIGTQGIIEFIKDKGLTIGRDVSVAGYENTINTRLDITCIDRSFRVAGKTAVKILLDAIDSSGKSVEHVKIPTKLFVGNTTGKAPG